MLCFVPGCVGLFCMFRCYVKKKALTEKRDMGLPEVPFSMSLLGFGMRTSICVVLCIC